MLGKFSEIAIFFSNNPDFIVPLLSILGTIFVVLYTVSTVLTKASHYDKISDIRGYNPKFLDYDLAAYFVLFIAYTVFSYFIREVVNIQVQINIVLTSFVVVSFALMIRRNNLRIVIVAYIFVTIGGIIGNSFMKYNLLLYLTILSFILFLLNGYDALLQKNNKCKKKVEIGICEDNGIKVMNGWLLFETESEIFFEVEEPSKKELNEKYTNEKNTSEKDTKSQSYIYRYNQSDVKYVKKELVNFQTMQKEGSIEPT